MEMPQVNCLAASSKSVELTRLLEIVVTLRLIMQNINF